MTNNEFREIFNDKFILLSKEELEAIIDEELEKSEEKMDVNLIEFCLDELDRLEKKNLPIKNGKEVVANGSVKKHSVWKYLIAALIAIMMIAGTLTVSAVIFDVDLFDGIVELYNDFIRINFDKTDDKADTYQLLGTDLAKELSNNGFDAVLLPEAVFSEYYEIQKIEYDVTEVVITANITFNYENKRGCINISKYAMEEIVPDVEFLNVTSNIEKLEIGNITVYCFMQNDATAITYRDGVSIYFIQLPLNLDEAIEFAKTIK